VGPDGCFCNLSQGHALLRDPNCVVAMENAMIGVLLNEVL